MTDSILPISTTALLDWPPRTFPNRTAIVHRGRRLTFAEFDARINRLANALLGLGGGADARVAVLVENSPQAVEVRFALMKAGLCMVPLNTRQSVLEQAEVVNHSQATCLIASPAFTERGRELMALCSRVKWFLGGEDGGIRALPYEELLATTATAPGQTRDIQEHNPLSLFLVFSFG